MSAKGYQPRRTLFVGGISSTTTEKMVFHHFKQFAKVTKVEIMKHKKNKAPKGFAYITLAEASEIPHVLSCLHFIEGRKVDCQVAATKKEKQSTKDDQKKKMVYVTNLPASLPSEDLHFYFAQFGEVRNAYIIYDNYTKMSKRFGYVEFQEESSAKRVVNTYFDVLECKAHCLPYLSKHEKREKGSDFGEFQSDSNSIHEFSQGFSHRQGRKLDHKNTRSHSGDNNQDSQPEFVISKKTPNVFEDKQVVTKDKEELETGESPKNLANNKPRKYEFLSLCARLDQSIENYKFNIPEPNVLLETGPTPDFQQEERGHLDLS